MGATRLGADNASLRTTFKTSDSFSYQGHYLFLSLSPFLILSRCADSLGKSILQICGRVPNGVLCFFPSYSLLERVLKRWNDTGLSRTLRAVKEIVYGSILSRYSSSLFVYGIESRSSESGFQESLDKFAYEAGTSKGALFLAVCRGKVSEGLDFSDAQARAGVNTPPCYLLPSTVSHHCRHSIPKHPRLEGKAQDGAQLFTKGSTEGGRAELSSSFRR